MLTRVGERAEPDHKEKKVRERMIGSERKNYLYVFIGTSCIQYRGGAGALERKTKPFQTILSNHNIFTALSVCLAQTDAI